MKFRILACAAALSLLLGGCAGKNAGRYPLDAGRIRADTEYMCNVLGDRPTGTEKERLCCDWLEEQLAGMGFSRGNSTLQRTGFQGFKEMTSENLVAVCNPGAGPILCVMAHYDTVEGTPGARDNTSAVATLLEIARFLGPQREELRAEVRLLFLGSEENGYHGATAYVSALTPEELALHLAAFNMEDSAALPGEGAILVCGTIGAVVDGEVQMGVFWEPLENAASRAASRGYQSLYGGDPLPVTQLGGSDHRVFQEAGIDAVNVNWRFFRDDGLPTVPPQYHKPTDTPDGMDFDSAVVTGRCILAALFQMAEDNG